MSFNQAVRFSFFCSDTTNSVAWLHRALCDVSLTNGQLEHVAKFHYFRLRDPNHLLGELRGRYETQVGDIERQPTMSVVDPLECWLMDDTATQTAYATELKQAHWVTNSGLPEGFRVAVKKPGGEQNPILADADGVVSVVTTLPNAHYLAFALEAAGVLSRLGPAYVDVRPV